MAAERAIRLTRLQTQDQAVDYINGFTLSVVVAEAIGMTDKIFVHRRRPIEPYMAGNPHYPGTETDQFIAVASAFLLEEYPEDEPSQNSPNPFFRSNQLEVTLRSTLEVETLWQDIQNEVCILVKSLCDLEDKLELVECVWCPPLDPEEEDPVIGSGTSLSSVSESESSESSISESL